MEAICLGIDLGTKNSRISCYFKGDPPRNPLIIKNEDSEFNIPSVVSFDDTQVLIGKEALNQRLTNPTNTICDIKKIIGKEYSDPLVQNFIKNHNYDIKMGEYDLPMFTIDTNRYKNQQIFPQQVYAMIISYLKKYVDKICTKTTNKVVLTVPNSFNYLQRSYIIDAARIVGLDPIGILNESSAACVAYAYNSRLNSSKRYVLVYDIGAGFLDVSLVSIKGGKIKVVATAGDSCFGGSDIDIELFNICKEKILDEYKIDLDKSETNNLIKAQLLSLCEEAKINLSSKENSEIILPNILPDKTFKMTLTRSDIEEIILNKQEILIEPINIVLNQARMMKSEIDATILIGGSSKIPQIMKLVEERMEMKTYSLTNSEEAVAVGASIYGSFKLEIKPEGLATFEITDVTPMTIGFGSGNNRIQEVVPRNTPLSSLNQSLIFQTINPNSKRILLKLYEGDSRLQTDCYNVALFNISSSNPLGQSQIQIQINVTDMYISLSATLLSPPASEPLTVNILNDKNHYTPDYINRMKEDIIKMFEF